MTKTERFKAIFEQYYSPLCNYALKIVYDISEVEEIVQNLFVQLWKRGSLDKITNLEAYLLRCVKYKAIDYLRHQNAQQKIPLEVWHGAYSENQDGLHENEIEPLLNYFTAKLPTKTREVFLLSRESKLTYVEIANKNNISIKTVEAQMSRALKMMRKLLKKHNFI